ncbi:peptidylprolyl isomerase [Ignavibacteria bacterium 4148-Me]|uniref:peptidylprolyl isomerase n=1 Tax=Rosettibacter primus TaxID=3111523 RepID=UPI00336C3015
MAMMARMRSLAPWFILLVGGLFVLFMVISDSRVLEFLGQRSQNVGSIEGEEISYQDFSNMVERAKENQERMTGQQIDESQMDFFRDQVWDAIVTQKLLQKKIKEFGIVVTDDEVREALLGPNPPEELRRQFTDSAGVFNRQLYEQALRDPRNKQIVLYYEDLIREQLQQQKLQEYLFASVVVGDEEVKEHFIRQNIKMRADYVLVNVNTIPENEIKISEDELKKYYNAHKEDYKIEPSRKLKYVLFRRLPSKSDSIGIKNNLEAIVAKIKSDTASFKSYVQIYSDQPYRRDTISITALPVEARDILLKSNKGDVIGPIATYEGYVVYKLIDRVKSKNEAVRASHILVRSTGNDKEDLDKANQIYNELIKGADFATVAKSKSNDPGSASNGGDLGWFTKGQMVKEFEEACFKGNIGVIQKPVKTVYGYHIIKVTGKLNEDFVIEKIVNKIQISGSTLDKLYQDASDFAYVAKENGFESEAKLMKYDVIETPPFTEDAIAIPGLGVNKALVKWAFENGLGEVSDVFKVPAGYVVVKISDVTKAGFKDFNEVKNIVRAKVLQEKRFEKALSIAKQIRAKLGDNGDKQLALTVWDKARVDSTAEFTSAGSIPNLGIEYAFADYALKGELNKWSQPVKGNMGVYLINVRYRTKFDTNTYELQKLAIRRELAQNKKAYLLNLWLQEIKKQANIVDNRHLFYR